jgi:hypothetical protein
MSDAFNQMLAQGPTPIKFADPVNQMAQIMQLKNYQQTGVVNQMAIDKGQRALDTENAVKALYAGGATPTTNQLFAVSPEAGAAARTAEGVANTQDSTIAANKAKTAKLEQESRNYKITQYGNALRSLDALPESERNAVYLNMIPHLAENLGPEVAASFPPAYDSKRIAALLGRSKEILDADQQVFDNEIKNRQTAASEMSAAAARDRAANGGAAGKPTFQTLNGVPSMVHPDGRSTPVIDSTTGKPFPVQLPLKDQMEMAADEKSKASRAESRASHAKTVLSTISDAQKLAGTKTLGFNTAAGYGGMLSFLPQTAARELAGKISTIKANLGFDRLDQMREDSKTGGALGAIAVKEIEFLQATIASLDQLQDPAALSSALSDIETHYNTLIKTLEQGAKEAQGGATPSPAGAAPPDGAGPATGGNKTFRFDAQGNPIP